MNYFKIINRFFDEAPDRPGYKTDHPALFYAIVDSINRNGWRDTEIEYDRIINKVKLGKKNYLAARDWLKTNRFIRVVPGRGDYQKARFGLGDAVLGKTATDTADDPANDGNAAPPNTAPDTTPDTAYNASAVLPETADHTASDTAPGTAGDTHLIGRPITDYILPITNHQQQHASSDDESDDGGADGESNDSSFQKKIGAPDKTPAPNPLPKPDKVPINRDQFRDAIGQNRKAFRYAVEQMKLATDQTSYEALIDLFLSQQEMQSDDEGELIFPSYEAAKRHFMNWLGTRKTISETAIKSTNGSQRSHPRGKNPLRPTAIGQPDYRGEGSTCNVDL